MKFVYETPDKRLAMLRLATMVGSGVKGIVKFNKHFNSYKVYQTNKLNRETRKENE